MTEKEFQSYALKLRIEYQKGNLSQDKIDRLNERGFIWGIVADDILMNYVDEWSNPNES